MIPLEKARRGAGLGAMGGFAYFVADAAGAFAAIAWMFAWTVDSIALLASAAVAATATGAVAGAVLGLLTPRRLCDALSRRVLLGLAGTGLCLVAGSSYLSRSNWNITLQGPPAAAPASDAVRAPVLWVVVDTMRADLTYGHGLSFPHTPNLRRFAEDAVVFADAESSAGWTVPSCVTLFTGVHHTTAGASDTTLPHWATTLAEHLHAAGYETRAVVDNPTLDRRNGFAAGFQSFEHRSSFRFVFSLPSFRLLPRSARDWLRFELRVLYAGAEAVTDAAMERIGSANDAPLFLYVHYMDPHAPYYEHSDLPPMPEDTAPINFWRARDRVREDPSNDPPTPAQLRFLRHLYTNELTYFDRHFGRLIDAWHRKYGDSAVVVVTSDHGEEFLEHGRLSHGTTVHRELVHVPLLIKPPRGRLPASRDNARLQHPVGHWHLLPTTLDLAGVRPTTGSGPTIQGTSLVPWMRGDAPPPSAPLLANHGRHGRDVHRFRDGSWVYMQAHHFDGRPSEYGLYDLREDPTEQHNLIDDQPDITSRMRAGLAQRLAFVRDAYTHSEAVAAGDDESLRALGYIQ